MDYAMPRGDDLPSIYVEANCVPTSTNPLGIKGAGEAGTVGAMPCVMNAAIDALSSLGITQLDMPLTPGRVWQAIHAASQKNTRARDSTLSRGRASGKDVGSSNAV